jgi:hypothetical protein
MVTAIRRAVSRVINNSVVMVSILYHMVSIDEIQDRIAELHKQRKTTNISPSLESLKTTVCLVPAFSLPLFPSGPKIYLVSAESWSVQNPSHPLYVSPLETSRD